MKCPHSFTIPMKPEKYADLYKRLNPAHPTVLPTGTETTSDVTLNWSYDGKETVTVNVTAAHSMKARLAPADLVQKDITDLLNS